MNWKLLGFSACISVCSVGCGVLASNYLDPRSGWLFVVFTIVGTIAIYRELDKNGTGKVIGKD